MDKTSVRYNTNLAAEFWVLSTLYRLGAEANLTLGNKKSVDILIFRDSAPLISVDVKGLADAYDWPADNVKITDDPNHFYVLLSFEGGILNPSTGPSVWIIPSDQIRPFIKPYRTRTVVSRSLVKKNGSEFRNAWGPFTD